MDVHPRQQPVINGLYYDIVIYPNKYRNMYGHPSHQNLPLVYLYIYIYIKLLNKLNK